MQMKFTFLGLFLVLSLPIIAQPPEPCTTGGENTCKCNTSPILCTIDELDGYSYSMTHTLHASDGPHGVPSCMCPGQCGTTSHNPTWFRFPAWCTDLELEVCWSNCTQNPNSCNSLGIQSAVYSECFGCPAPDCFGPSWNAAQNPAPYTFAVGCDVDGCGPAQGCAIYSMSGLDIGEVYYFLVDGCCGSACDVEINVLGVCGDPVIEDFIEIDGPTYVCAGGDTSEYFHPRPDGANTLHWFINDDEVQVGQGGSARFFRTVWTIPGEYELCFDASQDPCIDVDDPPVPTCITVVVYDITPEDPEPGLVCPGETYFFNGTQYGPGSYNFNFENEDGCDSNTVLVVNLVPIVEDTIGPFILCEGECIEIGGQDYCTAGNFSITLMQENPPNCDSILHFEVIILEADAGNLDVESPVCPEDTSTISVTGFNDDADFEQYILIADSAGVIVAVINGSSGIFTYDLCGTFTVYSLNFHPDSGLEAPEVGDNISGIDCSSGCCDMVNEPLIFEDTQAPTFVSPPASVTLNCYLLIDTMQPLTWNDNCMGTGTVDGVETRAGAHPAPACRAETLARPDRLRHGQGAGATLCQRQRDAGRAGCIGNPNRQGL